MTRKKLVSVVIATIGSEHLSETISSLNKGKLIPDEILICIPKNIKINKLESRYNNIKILNCPKRGQVAQRIFGFKNAKNELVLQLDDDVILQKTCLYILVKYIERHQSSSVGPQIYDAVSKKYTSFLIPHNNEYNIFNRFIYFIINGKNGFIPGAISDSGINMGIPEDYEDYKNIGWLPGCCILHKREALILEDYFPFKGKAYSEDLIHSVHLRERLRTIDRCGNANIFVYFDKQVTSIKMTFIEIIKYYKVMSWFVGRYGGSRFRILLFLFLYYTNLIAMRYYRKLLK